MQLGTRLSEKRKELGMTQAELAEKMHVTRQTVSRWEAGTAFPDVGKISDLASVLNVSCDYLLKDNEEAINDVTTEASSLTRLLKSLIGKNVKLTFYYDEADYDLLEEVCRVNGFEGNWMQVDVISPKGNTQKLVAVSSILSVEILVEG